MVDRLGAVLHKGDCVRYWHKVDGKPVPEIGEIVGFVHYGSAKYQEVVIFRKNYNNTEVSYRRSSGITKMSKGEAVLWKMEQYAIGEL